MGELDVKRYVGSGDIEHQDMRETPMGFFTALTPQGTADETLILADKATRLRVVLQDDRFQFHAYKLDRDMYERPGFLIPAGTISIEGERVTAYDATRMTAVPGDMILSNGKWFIAATNSNAFRDTIYLGIWDGGETESNAGRIGFRSWRLTVGEGRDKQVIFQRTLPPASN